MAKSELAVILVGHGGVPKDCPREMVTRLKQFEAQRRAQGGPPSDEELEADRALRNWPRTDATDPYRAGLLSLAEQLRPLLKDAHLEIAYNEFCAPSLEEAGDKLAEAGYKSVRVVTTMMTPGGSHAELDIPESLERLNERHPKVEFIYDWPFDMAAVAQLFASQIKQHTS